MPTDVELLEAENERLKAEKAEEVRLLEKPENWAPARTMANGYAQTAEARGAAKEAKEGEES